MYGEINSNKTRSIQTSMKFQMKKEEKCLIFIMHSEFNRSSIQKLFPVQWSVITQIMY